MPGILASLRIILALVASAALAQDDNALACNYIDGFENFCISATPSFTLLPESARASCLCYNSGVWSPDNYDGAYLSCASYIAAQSPVAFASLTSAAGGFETAPCRAFGNVRNAGVADPNAVACSNIFEFGSACASLTPGFDSLPFQSQAGGYCYSRGTYNPRTYDSLQEKCLSYFETATDPQIQAAYSSIIQANGGPLPTAPCADTGDVLATTERSSSRSTSTRAQPGSSPIQTLPTSTFVFGPQTDLPSPTDEPSDGLTATVLTDDESTLSRGKPLVSRSTS